MDDRISTVRVGDDGDTDCTFRTLSVHRTSLGLVRYQISTWGSYRILQGPDVVMAGAHRHPDRAGDPPQPTRRAA